MTNKQLKELEEKLWDSANSLRAYGGIKAADYAVPVLGLIFLRFAENKYTHYEPEILQIYLKEKGSRMERPIEKIALATCGFYLPEYARYEYLLTLPGEKSLATALRKAMEGIEAHQDEKFKDVLPKEAFFEIEKKKADILPQLLKSFSDIPKDASGDIFGKIYEYFLGAFAMSEGQKGGEFFTPTSVVRFIVEVIEPYAGKIYDPACGSGGMFVQSAKFIQETKHDLNDIYVYGQEYMGETARLAKMNLMVNNIRGEITEVNSYESDPYSGYGKFDFVMANPPFNVKSVKESTVKNDPRFYTYGLPKNKGKNTNDSISDANYLWVSLFATSLNKNGRAGFVMPNSASDAGNSEYDIRRKIVDSGIVDCMVSMPSNMFFTVTLPATLWFFDQQKAHTDRKDKILFIDARNTYHQIDRAHREWKEEQIQNLAAIVRLYRGETERYLELINHYILQAADASDKVIEHYKKLDDAIESVSNGLKQYTLASKSKLSAAKKEKLEEADFFQNVNAFERKYVSSDEESIFPEHPLHAVPLENNAQKKIAAYFSSAVNSIKNDTANFKSDVNQLISLWQVADKNLKLKSDKTWTERGLLRADKMLDEALQECITATDDFTYWFENMDWLQSRFPEATYTDAVGLCKLADKQEYAEEQDYSMNAGRYVGVEIEEANLSLEEFKFKLSNSMKSLQNLNKSSLELEKGIESEILNLL